MAASLVRLGAGSSVRGLGRRPEGMLVLFEKETCPFSRLVREALCELDLDALIKPCPDGEEVHREALRALTGATQVPYLIDREQQIGLSESDRIVAHLRHSYGGGRAPGPAWQRRLDERSSKWASRVMPQPAPYRRPRKRPDSPLELWNYEASPYCRLIRNQLYTLALPYLSRNRARHSPRRDDLVERYGQRRYPFLYDPSANVALFETQTIIAYLQQAYG